jgi:hypothetical protein
MLAFALVGCGRSARLEKQLVGTWSRDDGFEMTFVANGSFVSKFTLPPPKKLTYQGTWTVQNGAMFMLLTNRIMEGFTNAEAIGTMDHATIVRVDEGNLVFILDGQKISLRRKQ